MTKQIINIPFEIEIKKIDDGFYCANKSLKIDGYGKTIDDAIEMFKLSILEILLYTKT